MFKRYLTMIENTLLRIPGYIIIASVLVVAYFLKKRGIMFSVSSNVWENIFTERNLFTTWLPVAILILLSGVGISREDDAVRYVRMKNRTQLSLVNLLSAFTAVVLFSVAFMLAAVIYFRISQGLTLENSWSPAIKNGLYDGPAQSFPVPTVVAHFSPVGAVLLKLLYEIIYATFLAIVSMTVNTLCKQSVGSIFCALTIVSAALFGNRLMGEYSFYPWYNGDFRALTETNNFTFVFYSVIYWVVALTAVSAAYCLVMRKCDLISLSREDRT